jgi:hypothetical protein
LLLLQKHKKEKEPNSDLRNVSKLGHELIYEKATLQHVLKSW